jgi:hypothetical protein
MLGVTEGTVEQSMTSTINPPLSTWTAQLFPALVNLNQPDKVIVGFQLGVKVGFIYNCCNTVGTE